MLRLRPGSDDPTDGESTVGPVSVANEIAEARNEGTGDCNREGAVVDLEVGSNDARDDGYPEREVLGNSEGRSEGSKDCSSAGCVDGPDEELRAGKLPVLPESFGQADGEAAAEDEEALTSVGWNERIEVGYPDR